MLELLQEYHFIRPWWLLGFLVIPLLMLFLKRLPGSSIWHKVCDHHLLQGLVINESKKSYLLKWIFIGMFSLILLALAGPSWIKSSQPTRANANALVVLLDLSETMLAEDVVPSRLQQAKYKIQNMLDKRKEGLTALVAYTSEAFIITPLTDDTKTIKNLLNVLTPSIMPVSGDSLSAALNELNTLTERIGRSNADVLIVTDGVTETVKSLESSANVGSHSIAILLIGSDKGAPIVLPDGTYKQDVSGNIAFAKVDHRHMQEITQKLNAKLVPFSADDADVNEIMNHFQHFSIGDSLEKASSFKAEVWQDMGVWLIWLILPMVLWLFRKGVMFIVLLCITPVDKTLAMSWDDLWLTQEQQAESHYLNENFDQSANLSSDPLLRGASFYRLKQYQHAAAAFAEVNTPEGLYNLGNALAKNGQFKEAIDAYKKALSHKPTFSDAIHNKKIVEELLQSSTSPNDTKNNSKKNQDDNQSQQQSSSKSDKKQNDAEQAQNKQKDNQPQDSQQTDDARAREAQSTTSKNDEHAHAMRIVEDDPGGLLRRKLLLEYQRRKHQ